MKLSEIDAKILSSAPALCEGFNFVPELGVLKGPQNAVIQINSTGAWVLSRLGGTLSVANILDLAFAEFPDVNDEVLRRDVIDFIYNLFQWGYLRNLDLPAPSGYFSPSIVPVDEVDGRSGCGMCKESYV